MLDDKLIGEIGFSSGCGKCGRCVKGEIAIGYGIHQNFHKYGYEDEVVKAIIEDCEYNDGKLFKRNTYILNNYYKKQFHHRK